MIVIKLLSETEVKISKNDFGVVHHLRVTEGKIPSMIEDFNSKTAIVKK